MEAKYPGTCPACGGAVFPGDTIVRASAKDPWVHEGCRTTAAAAAPSKTAKAGRSRPQRDAMSEPTGAIEVFTDGACKGNPGPGGWAWAADEKTWDSGHESPSTNQRMEIRAAYEAVKAHPGPLVVVSDSTYVVNCFRDEWWKGWRRRGWVNAAKKPVANRDLWEPFVDLVAERLDGGEPIAFRWVKGHSGDRMNDLVDRLAVEASHRAG
ncbi:ribonuclease H [uncultured Nocardioides sp.]|uniref:ribonuclease H family protein n=1 Tax=uncultured Nocardioides sp. TaxID=198441 RepID=UPI002631C796|nr:ribonuclease H [uncultured Nocardioides sp.]